MKNKDIQISINKFGICDLQYKDRGKTVFKAVTIDSLVDALISNSDMSTPLLPPGVKKYSKVNGAHRLIMEVPPHTRTIKYINRSNKVIFEGRIPVPWMIWDLTLGQEGDNFKIRKSELYASKRPAMTDDSELYHYPMPNMFEHSGICWGRIGDLLTFNRVSEVGRITDIYFSGDFNTDLHPRINKHSRIEDMFRELKDKDKFDYDALVTTGKTLGDLTKKLGNNY